MRLETRLLKMFYVNDAKDFLQMNLNDNVMKFMSRKARIKSTLVKELEKIKK